MAHHRIIPWSDLRVGGVQLSKAAGTSQLDAKGPIGHAQTLGAALVHASVTAGRIDDHPPFGDGHRGGLFAVDILARPHRQGRRQRVPPVAGCDHYRVQVGAFGEEFVNVASHSAVFIPVFGVDLILDQLAPTAVDVADRQELHVRLDEHSVQHRAAAAAQPDAAQ